MLIAHHKYQNIPAKDGFLFFLTMPEKLPISSTFLPSLSIKSIAVIDPEEV